MSMTPHAFHRSELKELSTEFTRERSPDILPIERNLRTATKELDALLKRRTSLEERRTAIEIELQQFEQLARARNTLQAQILEHETSNMLEADTVDVAPLEAELLALTARISSEKAKNLIRENARRSLDSALQENAADVAKLEANLSGIQGQWLQARYSRLVEDLREKLHSLQDTLAMMLVIESDDRVKYLNKARLFIEQYGIGIRYGSTFRPTWSMTSLPRTCPGYANASIQLTFALEEASRK